MLIVPTFANATPAWTMTVDYDGDRYRQEFRWDQRTESWYTSIYNDDTDKPVALGVRCVVQYPLMRSVAGREGFPGFFLALDTTNTKQLPTEDNFGDEVVVYYFTGEERKALADARQYVDDRGLIFTKIP